MWRLASRQGRTNRSSSSSSGTAVCRLGCDRCRRGRVACRLSRATPDASPPPHRQKPRPRATRRTPAATLHSDLFLLAPSSSSSSIDRSIDLRLLPFPSPSAPLIVELLLLLLLAAFLLDLLLREGEGMRRRVGLHGRPTCRRVAAACPRVG